MSLATLKAKYKESQNISHSNTFSLNGGRRNLPYIGKTYFKEPKSTCLSNDNSVVKTSTGNTNTIMSSINKGPNVAKKGGVVCGAGPGSKALIPPEHCAGEKSTGGGQGRGSTPDTYGF